MSAAGTSSLLRHDLLSEVGVVVATAAGAREEREPEAETGFAEAIASACAAAGARVLRWPLEVGGDGGAGDTAGAPPLAGGSVLVSDSAAFYLGALRRGGGDGLQALRGCLEDTWRVTRALGGAAAAADAGSGAGAPAGARAGAGAARTIIVAPPANAGPHADAARAALENLVRTLSVEWARHRITTVAVAPGADSDVSHVGTLCAYLASRGGSYFSGCQLDMRGPSAALTRARVDG